MPLDPTGEAAKRSSRARSGRVRSLALVVVAAMVLGLLWWLAQPRGGSPVQADTTPTPHQAEVTTIGAAATQPEIESTPPERVALAEPPPIADDPISIDKRADSQTPGKATLRFLFLDGVGHPLSDAKVRVTADGFDLAQSVTGSTSLGVQGTLSTGESASTSWDPHFGKVRLVGGIGVHEWTGETSAEGTLVLTELPARVPLEVLAVVDETMHPIALDPARLEPDEVREIVWRQPPVVDLCGRLAASPDFAPARAKLRLIRADKDVAELRFLSANDDAAAETEANDQGEFRFNGLPPGAYYCGFDPRPGFEGLVPAKRVVLSALEPLATIELAVLGTASLQGAIVGATNLEERFSVRARRRDIGGEVTVDCRGDNGFAFEFRRIPPGEYELSGYGSRGSHLQPATVSTHGPPFRLQCTR